MKSKLEFLKRYGYGKKKKKSKKKFSASEIQKVFGNGFHDDDEIAPVIIDQGIQETKKEDIQKTLNLVKNVKKQSWNTLYVNKSSKEKKETEKEEKEDDESDEESDEDSDLSPRRRHDSDSEEESDDDEDLSPPRKRHDSPERGDDEESDDDLSPPRRIRSPVEEKEESILGKRERKKDNQETIEFENASKRRNTSNEQKTVFRKNGKIVSEEDYFKNIDQMNRKKREKIKKISQEELFWSKGVIQLINSIKEKEKNPEDNEKSVTEQELDKKLREVIHADDPMAEYAMKKKKKKKKKRIFDKYTVEKPTYNGSFPPNRFQIKPGFRWDGIVRGNKFESKVFRFNQTNHKKEIW